MTTDWRKWVQRFWNSVIWSLAGWRASWETEMGLRQWTVAVAISTLAACLIDIGTAERGMIIGFSFLVLAAELMNTGVEKAVDLVTDAVHPLAGKAKDAASAAVAMTALAAGAVWLVVLIG